MQTKMVRSLSMMQHMKHIFQKMMWHIPFMNVKEQRPVRSKSEVFLKMQDLRESDLALPLCQSDLKRQDVSLHGMWARRHGTKFNGAPYIIQRAGEAVYSEEGKAQLKEQVAYYMKNASVIKSGLQEAGYTVFGGVNAPYIWLKTPDQMNSWEFFDYLLANANVVGTPGSGFGPSGEGYFRLTAFGSYENTVAALERIKKM